MKRIYVALLSLVVILSACSKEQMNANYQTVDVSDVPLSIVQTIEEEYPDVEMVSALKVTNSEVDYLITFNTNEEVAFTSDGDCMGNANAFKGGRGKHHGPGHGPGGGHHGPGPGHGGGIPIDSLPTAITSFIATNFPADTIIGARPDSTCQYGKVIQVLITHNTAKPTKLVFDANNTYLYLAERVAYSTASQAVIDTVSSVYATYKVRRAAEKLTLSNASIEYNVYLNLNRSKKVVTIKDDGTIVCER